ncbi:methyl-accepting chemotaxis protein [Rhodopseudomonas rhenobacensis]|uniref:Methyl-accepting chemotaxis protein n=1 Tax=Rhodopseudomonas rhenobacensis TaxID=87461 RepID=A0A7W7Z1I0_9BRAD|nr:methyl-accepting chemotaxis protein [Rhodopseudomonas rhenobacensis]MBB5046222.1 methyl-accepting chemotaxis protein [Rhodopseudomonas rhenobacensis]
MLNNLSIRAKITIVVSFLLFALTGMGLMAVVKMRSINASTVEIQSVWLPSVRALGELRAAAASYRGIVRLHILSETAETKAAAGKRLQAASQGMKDIRKGYEKLIQAEDERALFADWTRQWESYENAVQQVLVLSREAAGRVPHEAFVENETKAYPIGKTADLTLDRAIDNNNRAADGAGIASAEHYNAAFLLIAVILAVTAAAGIGLAIYLVRSVSHGIASIVTPMQALGRGDLGALVPHQGERTEIGAMADTLQVFKQALIDKQASDEAAAREAEAKIRRGQRVDSITREFEAMIGEIVETVSSASTELEASASTLTSAAERAHQLTNAVAAASGEASSNVQSVASATEELSSSVNEIGRQVQDSARIANEAVHQAENTNHRVGELAKAAARIGDVVELINTIAGQTNLLALNATIEAARAGDAGRGFAVVASEVKALAEQTGRATGEISQQINGIQLATRESVDAIKEIGETIGQMAEIASTIASAVEQQGAATQEISRNVQQAAHGTGRVSANIGDVQRGASETGSASTQVLSAAQSLSHDSTRLKDEVGKFLASVRSA